MARVVRIVHILTSAVHQRLQFSAALPRQPTDVKCYYAKTNFVKTNRILRTQCTSYICTLSWQWRCNDNTIDDNNNNVFQKCNCFTNLPSLSLLNIFLSKREEDTVFFTKMRDMLRLLGYVFESLILSIAKVWKLRHFSPIFIITMSLVQVFLKEKEEKTSILCHNFALGARFAGLSQKILVLKTSWAVFDRPKKVLAATLPFW